MRHAMRSSVLKEGSSQCATSNVSIAALIGRVLHHLGCCMHGLCGDMSSMFALAIEFQMLPQHSVIAIEGRWGNIGDQVVGQVHDRADMTDQRSRNALGIRKVMETLIDLQQNHQCKLLGWSACLCCHKSNIGGGRGIDLT